MLDNGETPLIDATNAKIQNPDLDCSKLRDPLWALSDAEYHYAPDEPDHVDRSAAVPLNPPSPTPPAPPTSPSLPSVVSPSLDNSNGNNNSPPAPKPSNDCPKDFTGYWATTDCTSYMYCMEGNVVGAAQPCVPGTLFDITIGVCTWSNNVPGCRR